MRKHVERNWAAVVPLPSQLEISLPHKGTALPGDGQSTFELCFVCKVAHGTVAEAVLVRSPEMGRTAELIFIPDTVHVEVDTGGP